MSWYFPVGGNPPHSPRPSRSARGAAVLWRLAPASLQVTTNYRNRNQAQTGATGATRERRERGEAKRPLQSTRPLPGGHSGCAVLPDTLGAVHRLPGRRPPPKKGQWFLAHVPYFPPLGGRRGGHPALSKALAAEGLRGRVSPLPTRLYRRVCREASAPTRPYRRVCGDGLTRGARSHRVGVLRSRNEPRRRSREYHPSSRGRDRPDLQRG